MIINKFWQASADGLNFTFGESAPIKLPSGLYNIHHDSWGHTIMRSLERKKETLCNFKCGPTVTLLDELKKFWDSENIYKELGIAYKRSALLHGPAGCGKSGAIARIISETIANDGIVLLQDRFDGFSDLIKKFKKAEKDRKVVIIIEDIDKRLSYDEEEVLEIFDGNTSETNVFYISTTNFVSKLPNRFVNRPGRVDVRIEFPFLSLEQKKEYLIFLNVDKVMATAIAKVSKSVTLAQLKEMVTLTKVFGKTPAEAAKQATYRIKVKEEENEDE